jgi:translation initiation factor 1 (eIF-1/SUI1)
MNPFEDNDIQNNFLTNNITIWVETIGNKKNTYVSGWNISDLQLKDHLKVIKKKNGCNGTIKSLPNETNNGFINIIQLQGDHVDFIKDYLIKNDVLAENIKIKGSN